MKILVYTAIIGGYDKLIKHNINNPNIEFRLLDDVDENLDCVRKARLAKICPHRFFNVVEYDYIIWHDGNMTLRQDPTKLCETIESLAFLRHRESRKSILDEAKICIGLRKGNKNEIERQIETYKKQDVVPNFVYETGFNIRSYKKKPELLDIMEEWWKQIELFSSRDQLSLPYILEKFNVQHQTMDNLNTTNMRQLINFRIAHK